MEFTQTTTYAIALMPLSSYLLSLSLCSPFHILCTWFIFALPLSECFFPHCWITGAYSHLFGQYRARTTQGTATTPPYSDLGERRGLNICLKLLDDHENLWIKLSARLCPVPGPMQRYDNTVGIVAAHDPLLPPRVVSLYYLTFV